MGFTRYYTVNKKLNSEDFSNFSKDSKSVCDWVTSKYGHKIAGCDGYDNPNFTDQVVAFNGSGEDDSHETFQLSLNTIGFQFTKTQLKPYDKHVFATLIVAKYYFGESIEISGDGEDDDYPEISEVVKSFIRDKKINEIVN